MRLITNACLLLAAWFAAVPAVAQSHDVSGAAPAWTGAVPLPPALRPPPIAASAASPPQAVTSVRLGRYATWGMVIGGAVGLAYGVAQGDDTFGLSPVIEMAIGIGVGFYAGAAMDLVRSVR
ncbi:MAG TPA: hypothetical protein VGX50_16970 [Longimicrobium sp.]|jgi:hypothetical protein|nr:hypothetical protein [Longimicrobium sp.]